jgi:hypothetical protein
MPVWQRAVGSHLSTAYGSDFRSDHRQHGRRPGIKRDGRPSKRSNLYQEFAGKLKQDESTVSFVEPFALLSLEVPAEAAPCEQAPAAEMSLLETNEPGVTVPLPDDILPDSPEAVYLQEMMKEVQNDFSSRAGGLLDALGMGHMNRGSNGKAEDGNRKLSGKELVSALEKLVREHKSKVL